MSVVEALSSLPLPRVSRRGINKLVGAKGASGLDYSQLNINLEKRQKIRLIVDQLSCPEVDAEIAQGNIALGVVRPRADENALNLERDELATDLIVKMVEPELRVVIAFPIVFNEPMVENFWKPNFQDVPAVRYHQFPNAWEEFKWIMTRAASTVFLAHSPMGDAVPMIRKKVGHWKYPAPGTIRANIPIKEPDGSIANNLIHSSDKPESVKNELAIIVSELKKLT